MVADLFSIAAAMAVELETMAAASRGLELRDRGGASSSNQHPGRDGRTAIAVPLAEFDFASGSLSQHPVATLRTGSDSPFRIAVHPRGDGVVCALPKGWSGTGGDVIILNSTSMKIRTVVKNAHFGFVTALASSHDSRALISVSTDSSAKVQDTNTGGGSRLWLIIFVVLLAIAAEFMRRRSLFP